MALRINIIFTLYIILTTKLNSNLPTIYEESIKGSNEVIFQFRHTRFFYF